MALRNAFLLLIALLGLGLVAQDEKKPAQDPAKKPDAEKQDSTKPAEPKTEAVELEFKVGRREANIYNLPGFKVKEPLALEGKAAAIEKYRDAMARGLKYIFQQQGQDGAWKYDSKTQVRPEVPAAERGFVNTAGDSMNKVVLTSLCCMALRSHEELAPDRIRAAVDKGLKFVIENAPNHSKARYGIWTWSFAIEFMVDEYRRTKDSTLRDQLKTAIKATADKLIQNQHGGMLEAGKLPPKASRGSGKDDSAEAARRDKKDRQSNGGFFGVVPSDQDEPGKVGVLVQSVDAKGPAGKGGMKGGDRIYEIDGIKVESVNHLYDLVDSLKPDQNVKVKVYRTTGEPEKPDKPDKPDSPDKKPPQKPPQNPMRAPIPADGGWSYYQMASMSFATATAVLALIDAKEIGAEIPQESIDRGARFLEASLLRKEGADEDSYSYGMHARAGPGADIRASIGRVASCTLALLHVGRAKLPDLADALDTFVRRRGELDRVRGYPGNHFVRSFLNAAYYFLYGHYYSARALHELKDETLKKKHGAFIQEALLKLQYEQGTWTDHEAWGQLYGTAMATLALGQLKFVTPDAYKSPIESLKPTGENEY